MSQVLKRIERKLNDAFAPCMLEVVDDSARHAGHAGASPSGESHFKVMIVSDFFSGLSRIERHRAVYKVLEEELKSQVHALNVVAKAVGE